MLLKKPRTRAEGSSHLQQLCVSCNYCFARQITASDPWRHILQEMLDKIQWYPVSNDFCRVLCNGSRDLPAVRNLYMRITFYFTKKVVGDGIVTGVSLNVVQIKSKLNDETCSRNDAWPKGVPMEASGTALRSSLQCSRGRIRVRRIWVKTVCFG